MENLTTAARIHVNPGFAWDRQDAYLFDIDGTLLRSRDRIHFNSFANAIERVMDVRVSFAGVALQGSTDTAILREGFEQAGIASDRYVPQMQAILQHMREEVERERGKMDLLLMPGVQETLQHLAEKGALLGLATGNLAAIGWIKMEEAGLRDWFKFGGFSDDFPVRPELVADAARQARAMAGTGATVCVVGDTPKDIAAAHANGLTVIAVATGHFTFDELMTHQPEACASSLADLLADTVGLK